MKKMKNIEKQILFTENQRFRQIWLWIIFIISVMMSLYSIIDPAVSGKRSGNPPIPDYSTILLVLLFSFIFPILFFFTELRIRITSDGIYVKFFPIHTRWLLFSPNEIEKFEKKKYQPLLEYGGWGIRFGKNGKAYNVSGNMGILLTLSNGKRLLIGTQKPDEFERAIQEMKK